ncbi:MAG: ysM peptidoglycan-binding domain-containing protein, partial [Deltaproteobacteria bacterium]|nr:ysM peptidoglycan-binding domain-containing protein [Deltaproteobacteria bacterium]
LAPEAELPAANRFASPLSPGESAPSGEAEKTRDKQVTPAKPAKIPEPAPATLQTVHGPRADDRLLDLVEKDLDRAIEKPAESRRLEFSKAVIENPRVRYFVNYFSKSGKSYFEKILARSGKYLPMISRVLREEGLPNELAYLALIESGFVTNATSIHGAAGLWQFVPATARKYGLRIDGWIDERRDPVKSTHAAAAYLKDLHDYFGRWYLATAAYNAGQGALDRAMQNSKTKDFSSLAENVKLREETRNFVPKFVAVTLIATDPQKYGFEAIRYESPLEYEEIEIDAPVKLEALARMAGTDIASLRELNPALLRNAIPPSAKSFAVKIPAGTGAAFAQATQSHKEKSSESAQVVTHEVKKGETLFSIAKRYGQEVRALMDFNGLTDSRLRIGQTIRILIEGLTGRLR